MKRTAMPDRSTPLARHTPLRAVTALARTRLRQVSLRRAAAMREAGKPATARIPKRRDTGPSRLIVGKVFERANGWCEFPGCGRVADDPHHRYERGAGGTGPKSAAAPWINLPGNLLAACRRHNDWASNVEPAKAEHMGWILRDPKVPASRVPVMTCHSECWVLLDDKGDWAVWRGTA